MSLIQQLFKSFTGCSCDEEVIKEKILGPLFDHALVSDKRRRLPEHRILLQDIQLCRRPWQGHHNGEDDQWSFILKEALEGEFRYDTITQFTATADGKDDQKLCPALADHCLESRSPGSERTPSLLGAMKKCSTWNMADDCGELTRDMELAYRSFGMIDIVNLLRSLNHPTIYNCDPSISMEEASYGAEITEEDLLDDFHRTTHIQLEEQSDSREIETMYWASVGIGQIRICAPWAYPSIQEMKEEVMILDKKRLYDFLQRVIEKKKQLLWHADSGVSHPAIGDPLNPRSVTCSLSYAD